ncbi:RrF2 family transcriptional regulator [Pararhodobacter oceanensis]|uniref:RrF2 family transcriptional regulator n=1 Tax=Pararhodobacter oceanensis TaxID=2172121 RepID=UPI003A912C67
MRLTTRTNLALRTLMVCAVNPDRIVRKSDVAKAINASENHLAQVVNQLGQEGFLTTLRGRNGGFTLGMPAEEISVGRLFRRFEAELPFMECFTDDKICPLKGVCRVATPLHRAIEAFYAALDPVMLTELVECNAELDAILALAPSARMVKSAACSAESGAVARA